MNLARPLRTQRRDIPLIDAYHRDKSDDFRDDIRMVRFYRVGVGPRYAVLNEDAVLVRRICGDSVFALWYDRQIGPYTLGVIKAPLVRPMGKDHETRNGEVLDKLAEIGIKFYVVEMKRG